jgi:hypothetical protein
MEDWRVLGHRLLIEPNSGLYLHEMLVFVMLAFVVVCFFPAPILRRRYPRRREELADSLFLSSLAVTAGYALGAAAMLGALAAGGWVLGESAGSTVLPVLLRTALAVFLLIPVGQGLRLALQPVVGSLGKYRGWALLLFWLALASPVLVRGSMLRLHRDAAGSLVWPLALAVLLQFAYWGFLRWRYSRCDLV